MPNGRFFVDATFRAIDRFSKPLHSMELTVGGFTKAAHKGLSRTNEIVSSVSGGLVTAATAAVGLGAIGGAALLHIGKAGADFEQAITNVGAVMGKNRGQIADLEKEAMRLGVVTQFSSSEVADGMEMMARKGFNAQEILQGIPGVLNAVAASGEDMAEVTTIVGSSIRGFGLEASQAGHVADILALTAEKTGAKITDLGSALATAAPTAKALGVSIEDTTAAVGLMQKIGIDSSTAGSAVATMLAKISHPSKDAAAQMANLEIKFQNAKGDMLPFKDVLGQFVKAGDKTGGNMKRMAFFAELVGLRGDKAALALSDMAKSGDFEKLVEALQHADGYAQKVAEIRMDTTLGSWKLLTSTVEVLETKIFDLKGGAIKDVIDSVNKWVAANQDLIVSDVAGFIKKVGDNLPTIVIWLKRIGEGVVAFYVFAAAVKAAQVTLTAIELAVKAAGMAKSAYLWITKGAAVAEGELAAAQKAAQGSIEAMTEATKGSAAATEEAKLATEAGTSSIGAMTKAAGAGMLAIGALSLAWDQWKQLQAESGGMGVTDFVKTAWKEGTLDPAKVVDAFQNSAAKAAAASPPVALAGEFDFEKMQAELQKQMAGFQVQVPVVPQMSSPGAGPPAGPAGEPPHMVDTRAASMSQAIQSTPGISGEIRIHDESGRASVTKKPRGISMPLVPASGTL